MTGKGGKGYAVGYSLWSHLGHLRPFPLTLQEFKIVATEKYRPYLSHTEIEYILQSLRANPSNPMLQSHLVASLSHYILRIQMGAIKANHVTKDNVTTEDKLGLSIGSQTPAKTGEDKRKLAFNKWTLDVSACTMEEIDMAQTYRCENGLMSSEEEINYMETLMK